MTWLLHHVNITVPVVGEGAAFYEAAFGMKNRPFPFVSEKDRGRFDADRVSFFEDGLRQVHMCRPQGDIAALNGHYINPMLDGHVAFNVPDIEVTKEWLRKSGHYFADAGSWAFRGYYQLYVFDPDMNVVEINQWHGQFDEDLPSNPPDPRTLPEPRAPTNFTRSPGEENWWRLRKIARPTRDVSASSQFYSGLLEVSDSGTIRGPSAAGHLGLGFVSDDLAYFSDGVASYALGTSDIAGVVESGMYIDPLLHGYFGIEVADLDEVKFNLKKNDIFFIEPASWDVQSQTPIYCYDTGMNVIEIVAAEDAKAESSD